MEKIIRERKFYLNQKIDIEKWRQILCKASLLQQPTTFHEKTNKFFAAAVLI